MSGRINIIMKKFIVLAGMIFLLSCPGPSSRNIVQIERPDGTKVKCVEPSPAVFTSSVKAKADASIPKIKEILKGEVAYEQKVERIRNEMEGLYSIEVLHYRLCIDYGNGILDESSYKSFFEKILPLLKQSVNIEPLVEHGSLVQVKQSPGSSVVSAGRDLIIEGDFVIIEGDLVIESKGPPSSEELRGDIKFEKVHVEFKDDSQYPHFAALRISAQQHVHPRFYIRIETDSTLAPKYMRKFFGQPNRITMMTAAAIHGTTLEYTEGSPGLQPGHPWIFVVFSEHPVEIVDVITKDENPFIEVLRRNSRD